MGEKVPSGLEDLLILDRTRETAESDALYAFALDEWLGRLAGEGGPAVCHLWRHPRAFALGSRDARLPAAASAARRLEDAGYDVFVRHSGGAAVPLDLGVLNVSLILPRPGGTLDGFRDDFELMYALIREALAGGGRAVDKGEIAGAFCPGDFDLSIGGLKFCGIAQRRQTRATIVQAFLVAEGSGGARARLVREFYDEATEGADASCGIAGGAAPLCFPVVTEDSTASLAELLGLGAGAAAIVTEEIKRVVRSRQTEAGMAAAAAALRLPDPQEIREQARAMRRKRHIFEA